MRMMQISTAHDDYIRILQQRNKRCVTHRQCIRNFIDDFYWGGHILTPALERRGHEVFLCLPGDDQSQFLWCREHNISVPASPAYRQFICACQVAAFQPDVLYITNPQIMDDDFLSLLARRPRFVIGWSASLTPPHVHWTGYDLMLSSHTFCAQRALDRGARRCAFYFPGFPAPAAQGSPSGRMLNEVCFSGYWTESHRVRNQLLTHLARELPLRGLAPSYYIPLYPGTPPYPAEIAVINRGAVWGRSMFRAFASSRIVLNAYVDLENGPQNVSPNLRQMEVTGSGAMLLTQESANLGAFFRPGGEVETFRDQQELLEKILYFLTHEDERGAIAENGQRRCLHDFNMDMRALAFEARVEELKPPAVIPRETLIRTLRHLSGEAVPPELQRSAMNLATQGSDEDRAAVLAFFQDTAPSKVMGLNFARALKARATGQREKARRLLEEELADWPWNDDARQTLSSLLMSEDA